MGAWTDEHILTTYELAHKGYTQNQIAQLLGTTAQGFVHWKKRHPLLREALRRGWRGRIRSSTFSLREYIYGRLAPELQAIWNKIMAWEREDNGIAKVEALLRQQGKFARQSLFLHALLAFHFSLTRACETVNITRQIFYHWKETDPDFAALMAGITEIQDDFFEEHFCRLVAAGDSPATIWAVKTRLRHRGYGVRIQHDVDGHITHSVIAVDDLDLDLETKKKILQQLRTKQISSQEVPALPPGSPEESELSEILKDI